MQDATPLLITVPAQGERLIGRSVDAAVRLPHQSVSNRHAIIERIDGALVLRDLESKYGTHVNGMRIVRTVLRLDDQVRFGQATTYRVKSEGLCIDHAPLGVQLRCEHLNVFGLDHGSRVAIAQDISFSVEPSSFVGILGPSGCGKSTLLNVLATYHSEYDGRLRIDDEFDLRDEPERYCELLGHVPQTDLVHSQLTVRESLAFATELRGGDSQADVERVLELIELNSHADKQCRHLSGGQRKRLCVGYELLRRPRLLLLDEPTMFRSGCILLE